MHQRGVHAQRASYLTGPRAQILIFCDKLLLLCMFAADGVGSLGLAAAASSSRGRRRPRSTQPPMKRFLIKRPLNVEPRRRVSLTHRSCRPGGISATRRGVGISAGGGPGTEPAAGRVPACRKRLVLVSRNNEMQRSKPPPRRPLWPLAAATFRRRRCF